MCLTTCRQLAEAREKGGSGSKGCSKKRGSTVEHKTRLAYYLSGEGKGRFIKIQGRGPGGGGAEWDGTVKHAF